MPTLRLEIVTPEAKTYSEDVDMVTMPGADGELGILPLHTPLMALLKPGALRILRGGQETFLATGTGFAEVLPDRVSILTDMAVEENAINEAAAQAAMDRAQAAIKDAKNGSEEQVMAEAGPGAHGGPVASETASPFLSVAPQSWLGVAAGVRRKLL